MADFKYDLRAQRDKFWDVYFLSLYKLLRK